MGCRRWCGRRRCCPTGRRSRPCTGWPARPPGWPSAGWNATLSERVATEPDLAAAHAAAHASYLAQRDAIAPLPGNPGVGGLPGRVKCLHALYAHHAATGANPVGRIVSQAVDPIDCPGPCVDPGS